MGQRFMWIERDEYLVLSLGFRSGNPINVSIAKVVLRGGCL